MCKNNRNQEVKDGAIEEIWLCANGFRRNFYAIAYDGLVVYPNSLDSNTTPGMITTGIFSIELYLKFIHVVTSIKIEGDSLIGCHPKEHDLFELFNGLPNKIKIELENLYVEKVSTKIENTLSEYLGCIKGYYTELRYPYTSGDEVVFFNFDALKDVLEVFKLYSNKLDKYYWENKEFNHMNWLKKQSDWRFVNPCRVLTQEEDFIKKYWETGNIENNN